MLNLLKRILNDLEVVGSSPEPKKIEREGITFVGVANHETQKLYAVRYMAAKAVEESNRVGREEATKRKSRLDAKDKAAIEEMRTYTEVYVAAARYHAAVDGLFWAAMTEQFPQIPHDVSICIADGWRVGWYVQEEECAVHAHADVTVIPVTREQLETLLGGRTPPQPPSDPKAPGVPPVQSPKTGRKQ